MNYLNDPHFDMDEAQLEHFDQGASKRQRYLLWKERMHELEVQIEKDEAPAPVDADLYHENLRGELPLDVGIAYDPYIFPEWLGSPVAQQLRSGYYLDWLANCPYEMHDLVADVVLSQLIHSLKEDHKENFYYSAIQLLQSQKVAALMGQSTRNVRKKKNVILRKLRSGLYEYLLSKPAGALSLDDKEFLRRYDKTAPDGLRSGKEVQHEATI